MPTYIFDDVYGDQRPNSYSPRASYEPQWGTWDPVGGTCWGCTLGTNLPTPIDPTKAAMGTWHIVWFDPESKPANVSITFIGTSINAYCILPPNFTSPFSPSDSLSFTLDGAAAGTFEWTGNTSQWTYNYSVFSIAHLAQTEHTFVISPQDLGKKGTYFALDYFTYNFEDANTTITPTSPIALTAIQPIPSHSTPPAASNDNVHAAASTSVAVSGGVAAGVAVCVMAVLCGLWCAWRYKNNVRLRIPLCSSLRAESTSEQSGGKVRPADTLDMIGSALTDTTGVTTTGALSSGARTPDAGDAVPRLLNTTTEYLAQRRVDADSERAVRGAQEAAESVRLQREAEYLRSERDRLRSALGSSQGQHAVASQDALPPSYYAAL